MLSAFGKQVDILQAENNLSNVKLAEKMGIKPQNVPKLKRVQSPRKTTIHKISRALGVPVAQFID